MTKKKLLLILNAQEASLRVRAWRAQKRYRHPFRVLAFRISTEGQEGRRVISDAVVKVQIKTQTHCEVADGNGHINALDKAIRKALVPTYPILESVSLVDYHVHIFNGKGKQGTAAQVEVLIVTADSQNTWVTEGKSANVIEASFQALVDSFEYALLKNKK